MLKYYLNIGSITFVYRIIAAC